MTDIAFVGLGRMGTPMAIRLIETGHDLTVRNRSVEKTEPLRERGAMVARSPKEAVSRSEITITMLADEVALKDVTLGADGASPAHEHEHRKVLCTGGRPDHRGADLDASVSRKAELYAVIDQTVKEEGHRRNPLSFTLIARSLCRHDCEANQIAAIHASGALASLRATDKRRRLDACAPAHPRC